MVLYYPSLSRKTLLVMEGITILTYSPPPSLSPSLPPSLDMEGKCSNCFAEEGDAMHVNYYLPTNTSSLKLQSFIGS